MAKKQQIILTHGSNKPINVTGLTKGEVLVQHAANAEDLALWTLLDDGQTLEAISSKTYVDNRVKSAQKAATTKISKGDDANNNLSIERTVNDDGSTTYTIGLSDVAKQSELTSAVAELSEAIANETQQREAADAEILKTIEDNELVTSQALNELSEGIQTEKSEREAADADLQRQINEISTAVGNISIVEGDEESDMVQVNIDKNDGVYTISIDETNLLNQFDALKAADAALNSAITAETQAREAADAEINGTLTTLGNNLTTVDGKVTANEQAIAALQAADETIRGEFEAADAELSDRIDAINTSIAGGVHFIGVYESLDDIENAINGDIAIVESKEYIYSKSEDEEIGSWIELGDTTSESERISALEKSVEEITTVSLPNLETAIQTEKSEREAADAEILKTIEDNELVTSQALNELSEAIQTEKSEREAADTNLNNTISSINQDIENIKNNAVYTITVDNANTNKITVEKTNNTYTFNFDAMVIDGGEY